MLAAALAAGLLLGPGGGVGQDAPQSQRRSGPSGGSAGGVLFDADVARRGLDAYAHVIHRERIAVVDDPVLGSRRKVLRFSVRDGDTGPTGDPRAQVETARSYREGDDIWIGWSTLFPDDWPDALPPGGDTWVTLAEVYGPPYSGAAPVKLGMRSGVPALSIQRNGTYGWDLPWEQGPIRKGRWYDVVLHERLSRDPELGFVELWVDVGAGWRQQLLAGRPRLVMQTLPDDTSGPAYSSLKLYRSRGMYERMTVYHAEHRVGTSFDAVAPDSYGR